MKSDNQLVLKLEHIKKAFLGVVAVNDVSLDFYATKIHALLGHNGAGKSTLMKIISGAYQKDAGEITLNNQKINLLSPYDGLVKGISMVYQELDLIPDLSGDENIFLGQNRFLNKYKLINRNERQKEAQSLMNKLGADVDLSCPVKNLSVSKQQLIAIAKALSRDAKVMIFDEPTAALNDAESEKLFSIMHKLADDGMTIIWITHRLNEVFAHADTVSLMRDGHLISSNSINEIEKKDIVYAMTGEVTTGSIDDSNSDTTRGECLISCRDLCLDKVYSNISFDLHSGEVLGITGLLGCGATEIAKSLFSVCKPDSGKIIIKGKEEKKLTPQKAVKYGISYLPEDRKVSGLNLITTVRNNLSLTILKKKLSRYGFINFKKETELTESMIKQLAIKVSSAEQITKTLSGGNQQKVVLGKWLLYDADVFVMCEPTRGIDIGVKREIHRIIRELAANGAAVLVVSSEVEEVINVSDRMLLLYDGHIQEEVGKNQKTYNEIMNIIYGVAK